MIWHMFPGLDLYYTDPAQHVTLAELRGGLFRRHACPLEAVFCRGGRQKNRERHKQPHDGTG